MGTQIGDDRFDILIGERRIPGCDHAPHQGIPVTLISAGPFGDVLPEADGVVTGRAVQGEQCFPLAVGQKSMELIIRIGSDDVASTGLETGRGSEVGCEVTDDGIDIVAGDRSIENPPHPVHQSPPKGLISPLAIDDRLTDPFGTVAAGTVIGYQLLTLPVGQEIFQRLNPIFRLLYLSENRTSNPQTQKKKYRPEFGMAHSQSSSIPFGTIEVTLAAISKLAEVVFQQRRGVEHHSVFDDAMNFFGVGDVLERIAVKDQ